MYANTHTFTYVYTYLHLNECSIFGGVLHQVGSAKLVKHALVKNVTAKQQHQHQHVQNSSDSNNAFWPRPNQQQATTTTNETRTCSPAPILNSRQVFVVVVFISAYDKG